MVSIVDRILIFMWDVVFAGVGHYDLLFFSARVSHGAGLLTRVIRRYPSPYDIDERRRDFQADPWGEFNV
jgi:hypothetical protein